MKNYEGANIRNVALVGHSHSGKTSLASSMLFTAGATQRLGRVDEGNTTTDYDEEEISRAMSISAATAVVEWGKTKINLLDTPGFSMFIHEAEMALPAVEAALVVVDAVAGVEVITERIWQYCDKFALPRAIVCTRMDRERADFNRVMESLTTAFGRTVVPVQLPIGSEKSFTGVIDLVKMQAYTYRDGRQRQSYGRPHSRQYGRTGQGRARAPGRTGRRRRRHSDGRVLRQGHHRRRTHCRRPAQCRFAKTKFSPCSSPPAWATSAPTRCSTSWPITCLPRPSARP